MPKINANLQEPTGPTAFFLAEPLFHSYLFLCSTSSQVCSLSLGSFKVQSPCTSKPFLLSFAQQAPCQLDISSHKYFLSLHKRTQTLSSVILTNNRLQTGFLHHHPAARSSPTLWTEQRRWFWGIDVAFNKVDEERVRLAGPDRAAAEWVLRNAGAIKWTTSSNKLNDYNLLPSTNFESYQLEEIDLTATDVIDMGFQHLKNLKNVRKIILHGCRSIGDDALNYLHCVQDSLEHLEISRCPMITEKGLNLLTKFKKLKYLLIYDLIEIRNFNATVESLKKAMPWCVIDITDPHLSKESDDKH